MRSLSALFLFVFAMLVPGVAAAQGDQPKLALVIANSDYNLDGDNLTPENVSGLLGYVTDLPNARNDGVGVRDALERLGFRVNLVQDANRARTMQELQRFAGIAARARSDAIVVIYYSGHALQMNGANFLIPAGAQLPANPNLGALSVAEQERLVGGQTIALQTIYRLLRNPAGNGANLIFLDACRNNPWDGRLRGTARSAGSRGIADEPVDLRATLVAYSTAPGRLAADGEALPGANSPYTASVLRQLARGDLPLREMLDALADDERLRAAGQIPWTTGTALPRICLGRCRQAIAAAPGAMEDMPVSIRPARIGNESTAAAALAEISAQEWATSTANEVVPQLLRRAPLPAFIALANTGNLRAQWVVGQAYLDGVDVERDLREARRWLRPAADRGEPRAQTSLGLIYSLQGNPSAAEDWYRRAADQGIAMAQHNLANLYQVWRDYDRAMRWYRRAADQGFMPAQVGIGFLYESGWGIQQNFRQAWRWYDLAAQRGDAVAQFRIGILHRLGRGVPVDPAAAIRWHRLAADQGLAAAQAELGEAYLFGIGAAINYPDALGWFRRAGNQGHARARAYVGYMATYGLGVRRNDAVALGWLRAAAAQFDPLGQVVLGRMYRDGRGIPRDAAEAVRWFRRSADQGHSWGQFDLGLLLYSGAPGLPPDRNRGRTWIDRAAAAGSQEARQWLTANPAAPAQPAR